MLKSEQLLRIYKVVKVKTKPKYPPNTKHTHIWMNLLVVGRVTGSVLIICAYFVYTTHINTLWCYDARCSI